MRVHQNYIIGVVVLIIICVFGASYLYYGRTLTSLSTSQKTLDEIKYWGEIVVGTNPTHPPMEMLDAEDNPIGFDVDLAGGIAKELGVGVEVKSYLHDNSNARLYEALRAKKIDMIMSSVPAAIFLGEDFITSTSYEGVEHGRRYVVVFRKGEEELRDVTNLAIATLLQNGSLDTIRETWIAQQTDNEL